MSLDKIKQANRKWKHERKRRLHKADLKRRNELTLKKNRELFTVRRGQMKRRKDEISYVEALEGEIAND